MTDEKKTAPDALNEEALEKVSGGTGQPDVRFFYNNNCNHCRRIIDWTCPYGSIEKTVEKLGRYGSCPEKERF